MRICAFGDSFTHGTGDDTCLGWVGRLAANSRQGGTDLTLYNLGVRRETSADVAARLAQEALPRRNADEPFGIQLCVGANDCVLVDGTPRVAAERSVEQLRAMITQSQGWGEVLVIGALPVPTDLGALERVRALNEQQAGLCAAMQVPFVTAAAFVASNPVWRADLASGDGIHPGQAGYAALAGFLSTQAAVVQFWRSLNGPRARTC